MSFYIFMASLEKDLKTALSAVALENHCCVTSTVVVTELYFLMLCLGIKKRNT